MSAARGSTGRTWVKIDAMLKHSLRYVRLIINNTIHNCGKNNSNTRKHTCTSHSKTQIRPYASQYEVTNTILRMLKCEMRQAYRLRPAPANPLRGTVCWINLVISCAAEE